MGKMSWDESGSGSGGCAASMMPMGIFDGTGSWSERDAGHRATRRRTTQWTSYSLQYRTLHACLPFPLPSLPLMHLHLLVHYIHIHTHTVPGIQPARPQLALPTSHPLPRRRSIRHQLPPFPFPADLWVWLVSSEDPEGEVSSTHAPYRRTRTLPILLYRSAPLPFPSHSSRLAPFPSMLGSVRVQSLQACWEYFRRIMTTMHSACVCALRAEAREGREGHLTPNTTNTTNALLHPHAIRKQPPRRHEPIPYQERPREKKTKFTIYPFRHHPSHAFGV